MATVISIERYSANAFHFVIGVAWNFLCNIYLLLPALLLCILARTLSELLAEICQDMELAFADGQDVGPIVHVVAVRHSLVCQAVWRLDAFFSNVMLVTVACIFISSINYCFLIPVRLSGVNRNVTLAMAFSFAVALRFVVLDAIGYVAGCLKNKVHYISISK